MPTYHFKDKLDRDLFLKTDGNDTLDFLELVDNIRTGKWKTLFWITAKQGKSFTEFENKVGLTATRIPSILKTAVYVLPEVKIWYLMDNDDMGLIGEMDMFNMLNDVSQN